MRIEAGSAWTIVNTGAAAPVRGDRTTAGGTASAASKAADIVPTSRAWDVATVGRFQAVNDANNATAARMKSEKQRMEKIDTLVSSMKYKLLRIVKNYPPYSPEDAQRINYLKSFVGLRREIEQFIIPPDAAWLGPADGGDSSSPQDHVPVLSEMSSDPAIQHSVGALDAIQTSVTAEIHSLTGQSAEAGAEAVKTKAAEIRRINPEVQVEPLTALAAEEKSGEIGRNLSGSHGSLTTTSRLAGLEG